MTHVNWQQHWRACRPSRRIYYTSVAFASVILAVFAQGMAVAAPAASRPSPRVVLHGAGATFPAPLYGKWFQEYETKTGVRIEYQPIGSGGGFRSIIQRSVDFGAADHGLTAQEAAVAPGFVAVPTVIMTVAVVYNLPEIGNGLRLTPQVVAGIYLGKITMWNDRRIRVLNPHVHLPKLRITVWHRSDGSATTDTFTKWLSLASPEWKRTVGSGIAIKWPTGMGARSGGGIIGVLHQTPGGIGYETYAYALSNVVSYASLRNRRGHFVLPSLEGGTAAARTSSRSGYPRDIVGTEPIDGYPLSNFTYLLLYPDSKPEFKAFIHWALTDGAKDEAPLMYSPLPSNVTDEALDVVDRLESASTKQSPTPTHP